MSAFKETALLRAERARPGVRRIAAALSAALPAVALLGAPVVALLGAPVARAAGGDRPSTLTAALAEAYSNNPTLQQQRATLRATDENVPAALAGWRPTITIQGSAGRVDETSESAFYATSITGAPVLTRNSLTAARNEASGQITVNQSIFDGGLTIAKVHQAKNDVYAARAQLLATEQDVFGKVVTAYVTVITDRHLLDLDRSNEGVLAQQLRAVKDQFKVGEITETSVAQAEASLAGAQEQIAVAKGNLHIAEENFRQLVGAYPAKTLVPPQPLALGHQGKAALARAALANNPAVVAALFTMASKKDGVDAAVAGLGPQLSLSASAFDQSNPGGPHSRATGGQILANLTIPLYQGGKEYAAIRQARDNVQYAYAGVIDAQRAAVQQATQAFEGLQAARAAIVSSRAQIRADAIALDGTERQEIVGTRDTLDVLNAQQLLFNAQTTQIQNIATEVNESYAIAAAVGRLTASDLALPVTQYDDLKYYDTVKGALFGNGNEAFRNAGITPDGTLLARPKTTPSGPSELHIKPGGTNP
ncbi:MAG TPA: TolC family outer membrane protein [Acidiphilium sp.]|uniref:TolC family outer membrane protein n=1 Tax=unclassified Acidiphilium TaxID=2617493 RepID=UPI000BCA9E6F|nr:MULTISPECIES: TolC family outer membrane protein [unclassified Acidiphilium]OYV54972.1 MAG: channel protein TolC [Acidiphilium sp. 20-67-58]OYV87224.1 MAG: channel protein TolC [Acidiphilium sp. 21-68-69]HQT61656.1 TolC family outer membrane protein [Acidiphilium sp.]HQU10606.1 TolC family outer membrane protein [Acidiphilium sp.]